MKIIDDTRRRNKKYPFSRLSKSGKTVQSNSEQEIANYLDHHGIPYLKPKSAFKGQYYKNYGFVPDFLIDNVIIEFFGIKGDKNYDKTIDLKKQNKYPNKEYIFLYNINKIGSLCTRFKHLIGKNPQIDLNISFGIIDKEMDEFKNLLSKYYNDEVKEKILLCFNKECYYELKKAQREVFDNFMRNKGEKYLKALLEQEKQKILSKKMVVD